MTTTAEAKMTRARVNLLLDEPFFGSLVLNLRQRRDDAIPTMATNGRELVWSATFVQRLTEGQLKTVLAHEAMHCALLHQLRRGERDPRAFNVACDYALNQVLEECNEQARAAGRSVPFEWPAAPCEPLLNPAYTGMSAEEIYNLLPKQGGGGGGASGKGGSQPQSMGDVNDDPSAADEAEAAQQEAQWRQALVQAAMASKGRGNAPASMVALIDELLNPKADWRELLRRFVRDRAADDYSWTRPNSRYAASGFVLPSLYSQRMGVLGVIRDTSGSTQDWQREILAELAGIIGECRPAKVIVMDADAAVARVLELDATDPLPTDAVGGGGTAFEPALAAMEAYAPVACVYLTDLDGSMPDVPPSFPVLWATSARNASVPFGEVVEV